MTSPDYTAVMLVVDRSGSMAAVRSDAEGAINQLLEDQRALPGRCTVRLVQFDGEYEEVYPSTSIADVPRFVLKPRGNTALLDAIGKSFTRFGEELAALPEHERPGRVVAVVQTDGEENSSKEWTLEAVRALVTQQREQYSWDVLFLGAGEDAISVAQGMGFAKSSSIAYSGTRVGTESVVLAASEYIARSRSGSGTAFTDEERAAAQQF